MNGYILLQLQLVGLLEGVFPDGFNIIIIIIIIIQVDTQHLHQGLGFLFAFGLLLLDLAETTAAALAY